MLPASTGYPADQLPFGNAGTTNSGSLSTTMIIIDPTAPATLQGSTPPVAQNQDFSMEAEHLYFTPEHPALTNAVAAEARTVSIALTDPI